MTTPTIFSTVGNQLTDAPCLRNGGVQMVSGTITVPAGTASGTVMSVMPFQAYAKVQYSSMTYVPDLDTGTDVTLDIGYVYDDNTTYTNDPNAFVAASTVAQSGGLINYFTAVAGASIGGGAPFEAEAPGWFTITTGGGTTTTAGVITFQWLIEY